MMKNVITIFLTGLLCQIGAFAQTISYQGIARNTQGAPLSSKPIAVRLSIKNAAVGGNTFYTETKSATTNEFGLYAISVNDGSGNRTGSFESINWSQPTYMQTEIDPENGAAFADMGTSLIQSVPSAIVAKNLEGVTGAQDGDRLEFENGIWTSKPKTKRYHVKGFGLNPSSSLSFLGPTASVTIVKDNPTVTIYMTKAFGTIRIEGAAALNLNLGYRIAGGEIKEFDTETTGRIRNLRVTQGIRIPMSLSGSFQTTFKAGETYEIGMVGLSPVATQWNDNDTGKGFVEISY